MDRTTDADRRTLLADLLVKTSRTFALSIPPLPQPLREEVTIAYLLFRIADTLEDATLWSAERKLAELGGFGDLLRQPDAGRAEALAAAWVAEPPLDHEGYLELLERLPEVMAATRELDPAAGRIVRDHTLRTADCMAAFVRRTDEQRTLQLQDIADLQSYCYAVAGIVGEMLTELFLLACPELADEAGFLRDHAVEFGEALQLVNILKDSATDAGEGRSFLPSGVDRGSVFALARRDLEGAGSYVRCLQRAGAPRGLVEFTALPVLLAWRTLERVEEQGPGSKLSRPEVREVVRGLAESLDRRRPAVEPQSSDSP